MFILWTSGSEFNWWYSLSVTSAAFAISRPAHRRSESPSVNVIRSLFGKLACRCWGNASSRQLRCHRQYAELQGAAFHDCLTASSCFLLFEPSLGPNPQRQGRTGNASSGLMSPQSRKLFFRPPIAPICAMSLASAITSPGPL